MKNNFKLWCTCLLSLLINSIVPAETESAIVYKQKVTREDVSIGQAIRGSRGTIYLTKDSVIFKARKEVNRKMNFSIAYNEIKSAKRVNRLFFPNRISISVGNGEKYRLLTYRRRQLIEGIRKRLT